MSDNQHASRPAQSPQGEAPAPLRVLIAEDHDSIRRGLLVAFRRAGYHCEEASDGRQARKMITSTAQAFHLFVTDHEMPHSNGLELVGELKQHSPKTRVIVFSGSLTDTLARAYRDLGVSHIISKPASFLDLLQIAGSLRDQLQAP